MASNPFWDEMRRDPYRLFAELRRRGPVIGLPDTRGWMILDYPLVRQALGDFDRFGSDVPGSRRSRLDWLVFMDPPRQTRLRSIIGPAFSRSLAGLEARVQRISARLLDRVKGDGALDLVRDFAEPLPLMVVAELLGLPPEEWERLKRWSASIASLAEKVVGADRDPAGIDDVCRSTTEEIADEISRLLAARRVDPRDDLLTALALAEVNGDSLTGDEILRFLHLLFAAGGEPTTNLIANAVVCLLDHPDELARLRASPGLLGTAIEETLRYRTPIQSVFRVTRQPVTLGGQELPAGELVLLMIGAANRDPKAFAQAERFDVGRDPNPHLAFGGGIHACFGAPLARVQARVALGDLLARTASFRRVSDLPWEPRRAFYAHGPTRLPIVLEAAG